MNRDGVEVLDTHQLGVRAESGKVKAKHDD